MQVTATCQIRISGKSGEKDRTILAGQKFDVSKALYERLKARGSVVLPNEKRRVVVNTPQIIEKQDGVSTDTSITVMRPSDDLPPNVARYDEAPHGDGDNANLDEESPV